MAAPCQTSLVNQTPDLLLKCCAVGQCCVGLAYGWIICPLHHTSPLIFSPQDLLMASENILTRFRRTIWKPLKWYQTQSPAVEQSCRAKLTHTNTCSGQLHIQPLLQCHSRSDQAFNPNLLLPRFCHACLPKSRPGDHNFHRFVGADHHHCFGASMPAYRKILEPDFAGQVLQFSCF